MTETPIQWALRELQASRPSNHVFIIPAAKAGVQLCDALRETRKLQAWARRLELRLGTFPNPPRISLTFAFPGEGGPAWTQEWYDSARATLNLALSVTSAAHALDRTVAKNRKRFHILETPWVAMAANANLVFRMKTKFPGAKTTFLRWKEILYLEIICGLQDDEPSHNHSEHIRKSMPLVRRATKLLRTFPVGAFALVNKDGH